MRVKQAKPMTSKVKYRQYPHSALTDAYIAVKEGDLAVAKASRVYQIPMQTLRDRVIGKIDAHCVTTGRTPLLSLAEEAALVEHLKTVANYGYGYSRQEVVDIASDYAVQLGKRGKDTPFTLSWFRKFKGRWPELSVVKPRGLELARAEATSEQTISEYFNELESVIKENDLSDKPHLIFNLDEKGITQDHTPPHIVISKFSECQPQAVTSGKSKTTTILGCGSASGVAIPPYFVFAGKRLMPELTEGATPGAVASMSDSGWSTTDVFRKYLKEHFIKYIPQRPADQKLLLIVDGHKSHIAVDIVEWAKDNNIEMFVLPAHTSHILQPLDVGCYGPFQRLYHDSCHKFMRKTSTAITRYDICRLACGVYYKALSADNLHSAFRRTGIYPFNRLVISKEATMPSQVFMEPDVPTLQDEPTPEEAHTNPSVADQADVLVNRLDALLKVKRDRVKKHRNTISRIVSGKSITNPVIEKQIAEHVSAQKSKPVKKAKTVKAVKKRTSNLSGALNPNDQPGPSHINLALSDESDSEIMETDNESDKCCECLLSIPVAVSNNTTCFFINWAKCDGIGCTHWVHLRYCTPLCAVRRGVQFYCSHCSSPSLSD